MATKTTGIRFEFTGNADPAVKAFRQIAAAAKASGGDMGKAGQDMLRAIKQAEEAAAKAAKGGFFDMARAGAAERIQETANNLGLGGALEALGGSEELLGKLSSRAVVATGAVLALGAVTAKVGLDSSKAYLRTVEAVDAVGDVTGANAEQSSKLAGIYRGLGLNVESAAGSLGKFAKNVTSNQAQLVSYGVAIARTADGGVDIAETLLNVASAYQAQTDPAVKAQIAAAAFGKEWASMVDVLEVGRAKLEQLKGIGPGIEDADLALLKEWKAATGELGGAWNDLKVTVGRPIVFFGAARIEELNNSVDAASKLLSGDFSGAWDAARGRSDSAGQAFDRAALAVANLGHAAAIAGPQAADLGDELVLASAKAASASAAFSRVFDAQATSISAQVRFRDSVSGLAAVQTSGAAAGARYAAAQDGVAEAVADQSKAAADAAHRIADAEASAARQIADAQGRVADARKSAARAAEDSAQRVADAEQDLVDAATAAAGDNPLDQQRRIEDARIALDRAKLQRDRDLADSADDVAQAEGDLQQAQSDGAKQVADAQRAAAEAQAQAAERVAKAQQAATEALDAGTVSLGQMTGKADDLVKSTYDAAFQIGQMGGSQRDVNDKVNEGKKALDDYGPALGLTVSQIAYYKGLLDLIPSLVPTEVRLTFTQAGVTSVATAGVQAGIAAALAQLMRPPEFAGGGTFRTRSGGAGLAVLHDGEKVLTPEQQRSGGDTIIIHGSLITERQLGGYLQRQRRRGMIGVGG